MTTAPLLRALVCAAAAVVTVRGLLAVPGGGTAALRPRRRPVLLVASRSGRASTGPATASVGDGPYGPLLSWLRGLPGAYVHPHLSLGADSPAGEGGGASLSGPVTAGEVLALVPLAACPCAGGALDDAELGPALRKIATASGGGVGGGAGWVALAAHLAFRSLAGGGDEEFGPYLRTLPLGRPGAAGARPSQEHVLWWTDREVDAVLGCTDAHAEAVEIRAEVDLAVRVLRPIVRDALRKRCAIWSPLDALAGLFARSTPAADASPPSDADVDDAVRGSFVAVLSRGFEDTAEDGERGVTMEPLVDMMQHGGKTANVRHGIRDGTAFAVEALSDLGAGTELLNSYSEDGGAGHFFVIYGFVPEGADDPSGVREAVLGAPGRV